MRPEKKNLCLYGTVNILSLSYSQLTLFTKDRKFPPPPRTIPVESKLGHVHSVQEIYSAETVIGVT